MRLRSLAVPAFRGLHAVWAQSEADAERLRQLGAHVAEVTVATVAEWCAEARKRGIEIVPVSALLDDTERKQ